MDKHLSILKQYWGYDNFRGIQREIIESVAGGNDTLGLMPTGGGKSICFQVPALAMEGLCIVVTPLVALMKDQVMQLRSRGIKAEMVHSGMMHDEQLRVLDNCALGDYKFLYVSPERTTTELFRAKLMYFRTRICMITVDEAHCVSQWGYDFRPSYLKIAELRHVIPYRVPVLALTATATPKVVDDIQEKLEFAHPNVFAMSFERKNLIYVVRHVVDKESEIVHILKSVTQGSAIVYTRNRQATAEIARELLRNGISADNFHAGLTSAEKDLRQKNWTEGRTRVMVATNAFGMGIDKSDVRLVIHYNTPDSVEAYFQEAGRAGRDGKPSYAVLLHTSDDIKSLRLRVRQTYPSREYIAQTYDNLCYFLQVPEGEGMERTFKFDLSHFCVAFRQFENVAENALRLLTNAGYIEYHEHNEFKSRIMFTVRKEELYRLNGEGVDADKLIQITLRMYTGLFADYVCIEEELLAHATGLSIDQIYQIFKELARKRIINFIPRSSAPTISFPLPRIDSRHINLTTEVYDDRLADYSRRIERIISYISSDTECRSRFLLSYFGQTESPECGQCDVCLARKKSADETDESIRQTILRHLSGGGWHSVEEFNSYSAISRSRLDATLRHMVQEEELEIQLGKIRLAYR